MERAEAARKRRRVAGYDTGESWQQIKALNCKDLVKPNQVTIVPYMDARNRGSFLFVGSPDMDELLWHCLSLEPGQELVVVGPKGTGKSCRLRAMAAALYARGPEKSVIVCVWNLESASSPAVLLRRLLDGLRFAYSGADEHKPVLEALEALWRMGVSVARLQEFLRERAAAGDDFTFVADGAEALDTRDYSGTKKVGSKELKDTLLTLEAIVSPYKIVWGASPEARQAEAADSERVAIYCVGGFTKEQREVFLLHSVLGAVVAGDVQRTKDMDFFAGFHPQFLDELDGACMEIARIKQAGGRKSRLLWGDTVRLAPPVELEPHEVSLLLKDEEDWQRVLLEFINGRTMSFVRRSVQQVVRMLDNAEAICNFHGKAQTIDKDPRYSVSEHEFCSCFVEQIYMEEFRKAQSCPQQEHAAWWNILRGNDWQARLKGKNSSA
ncbi:hypothetical protein SELMODRAFT_424041 [Selaginella moellendorffii]|uniref:Uncharacterized protein n=1 Tax=Selaginella moellendorffii TaxID=88036 RepID=D8SNL8_SELML|nr:uncharacterized protein LOC9648764 [Selaginella moellendorffii]EFJ14089.1 hypothetical protein SELMODRAFT_424041 [Selaginella moellendorffii]|eukprot:XP_002984839.1 uncharacterized protein LOC9648764 [Selaginella moellendorffii]